MKISNPSKIDIEFVRDSKSKLSKLVESVKSKRGKSSWVFHKFIYYLQELNTPFYKKLVINHKALLIHSVIIVILFGLTEYFKR